MINTLIPVLRKAQLSFGFMSQLTPTKKTVREKSGKTHVQTYHTRQEPPKVEKPVVRAPEPTKPVAGVAGGEKPAPATTYTDDQGREVVADRGIGDKWGVFRKKPNGSLERVKSSELPMVGSREEAQASLDAYAQKKGWSKAGEAKQAESELIESEWSKNKRLRDQIMEEIPMHATLDELRAHVEANGGRLLYVRPQNGRFRNGQTLIVVANERRIIDYVHKDGDWTPDVASIKTYANERRFKRQQQKDAENPLPNPPGSFDRPMGWSGRTNNQVSSFALNELLELSAHIDKWATHADDLARWISRNGDDHRVPIAKKMGTVAREQIDRDSEYIKNQLKRIEENDPRQYARLIDKPEFAAKHGITTITVDGITYRLEGQPPRWHRVTEGEKAPPEPPTAAAGEPKHGEVGEHIWGSRADKAAARSGSIDLSKMTEEDARRRVKKAVLLPEKASVDDRLAAGYSAGAIILRDAIERQISAAPGKPEWRQAYIDGIGFLSRSLDNCKTAEDIVRFVEEWRGLAEGRTIIGRVTTAEMKKFQEENPKARYIDEISRGMFGVSAAKYEYTGSGYVFYGAKTEKIEIGNTYAEYIAALGTPIINIIGGENFRKAPPKFRKALDDARDADRNGGDDAIAAARQTEEKTARKSSPKVFQWEIESAEDVERMGATRTVKTADAEAMAREFGFTNVQYGSRKYMTDSDREHHIIACHNALYDLSEILHIPPETIAMNGRLGIGFGARGGGNAKAHYEPSSDPKRRIINITKYSGGGSLAHEWGHALDHLLAVSSGGKEQAKRAPFVSEGDSPDLDPRIQEAFDGVVDAMVNVDGVTAAKRELDELTRRHRQNPRAFPPEDMKRLQKLSLDVYKDRKGSQFHLDSVALGEYWSRRHEMFARAFAAYVEDKLAEAGKKNTYLTMGTTREYQTGKETDHSKSEEQARNHARMIREKALENPAVKQAMDKAAASRKAWMMAMEAAMSTMRGGVNWASNAKVDKARRLVDQQITREAYADEQASKKLMAEESARLKALNPEASIINRHAQPFPQGDERRRINAAFDRLFSVISATGALKKALLSLGSSTRARLRLG